MTTCFVQAAGTIEMYFYDELDAAARADVDRHLALCAECRQALGELETIRHALATRPDVAAPAGGDWTGFMSRLESAVQQKRRDVVAGGPPVARRLIAAHHVTYIAMAALLAIVTLTVAHIVRLRSAGEIGSPSGQAASTAAPWSEDEAFASLSEQHFERAKLVVLGLASKSADDGLPSEWEYERELASTLLADTRLYRLAAEDRGMKQLARIMGDLELVLVQTSMSSDQAPETLAQIQSLIRKRDLVTRMNVMAGGM